MLHVPPDWQLHVLPLQLHAPLQGMVLAEAAVPEQAPKTMVAGIKRTANEAIRWFIPR